MTIASVNPATEEVLKTFTPLTPFEIEDKLSLAVSAFADYRKTSLEYRQEKMFKTAEILEKSASQWAELITLEMGKPFKQSLAEINKSASVCRFYGENAKQFLSPQSVSTDASYSYVFYQPLGVILAVMPWNFPFWQVLRFAAPALMAGNIALLKHASNVPQCAIAIESIFRNAGFDEGVFQSLLITSSQVEGVLRDERIKAVTLTGSELAGRKVASVAGDELKKSVLELGGSDPFIVMESANLEDAVNSAVTARLLNNGQSCIAAKRFILHSAIASSFQELLMQKFQQLKIGNPLDKNNDLGPLATYSMLEEIKTQVEETVTKGGRLLMGGKPMEGKGYFYPPTILTDIPPDSPAMTEEFFAPVALLFTVDNLKSAIALANYTSFGLGASIWTNKEEEAEIAIKEIEAGAVFVNGMVKSDVRLPFGGIKRSGYGRELSREGMLEFMNVKTVWIK